MSKYIQRNKQINKCLSKTRILLDSMIYTVIIYFTECFKLTSLIHLLEIEVDNDNAYVIALCLVVFMFFLIKSSFICLFLLIYLSRTCIQID